MNRPPLRDSLLREADICEADGRVEAARSIRAIVASLDARRGTAPPAAPAAPSAVAPPPPLAPAPPPLDPAQAAAEARRTGEKLHAADCDCRECIPEETA